MDLLCSKCEANVAESGPSLPKRGGCPDDPAGHAHCVRCGGALPMVDPHESPSHKLDMLRRTGLTVTARPILRSRESR